MYLPIVKGRGKSPADIYISYVGAFDIYKVSRNHWPETEEEDADRRNSPEA